MVTMQEALARLSAYWTRQGCLALQPMNTEVGAGTLNPATALRVLGPEPWRVAYVEPSVRPDDARYGENPNRMQCHTQFQVILKPEPGNAQEVYLDSLTALGIALTEHDVRFVEDNWASPALGAWGLGWEVWLDGLEITQFTYFQQAGGVNLDPVSVEITYGIERIMMALQGARHFKDIEYAPGVRYGDVFGEAEYEMSRYYLDDADVAANRVLLGTYAGEAQRMIDAGLPVPAHSYVLKMSHTFNVLDSRGAVSTAERAGEFARMRRLSNAVAKLWVSTRDKAGFPLGVVAAAAAPPARPAATPAGGEPAGHGPRRLVLEIGVEEMPPAEAEAARVHVEATLTAQLAATLSHGAVAGYATPRRIVAIVEEVAGREPDRVHTVRGPRTSVAFGPDGAPTQAAQGFARANGVEVAALGRVGVDGVEHVAVHRHEAGRPAAQALADMLAELVRTLRSAKNMRWNDPQLSFTRPIRWLVALLGEHVVPVRSGNLAADRYTRVHRTAAQPVVPVPSADRFVDTLAAAGITVDQTARRRAVIAQATELAASVGGRIDEVGDAALIEEITLLVEAPTGLLGAFDGGYLDLPEPVLTTVMRKHQRYLPIRDAAGRLLPHFIVVANGDIDPETVRAGNEVVLRARFDDAAFFYRADLAVSPTVMRSGLARLTFTNKLGSMLDRANRIGSLAGWLGEDVLDPADRTTLARAAELVKFDLASQMVVELTSLAGTMAREYALAAGEDPAVAQALLDVEVPRAVGDRLPATAAGSVLAFADRLDALVGLAATVGIPTGSSDPFAVRRATLGLLTLARSEPSLAGVSLAAAARGAAARQPVPVDSSTLDDISRFLAGRLEQQLLDEGHPVDRVRAVLGHADRPGLVDQRLAELDALVGDPDFTRVATTLQRARRIVPAGVGADYDVASLVEPAERRLHETLGAVRDDLAPGVGLPGFIAVAAPLADAVDRLFTDVLVMADDPRVRQARLGLLAAVRDLGAGQLAWEELRLPA